MSEFLFVYGTLRPTLKLEATRHLVEKFEFIGRGLVNGIVRDLGEYPGAQLTDDQTSQIEGELVAVPDDEMLWQALDDYEGFDPNDPERSLFIRQHCSVRLSATKLVTAWIYTYNGSLNETI